MKTVLWTVAGTVVGLVVAFVLVIAVEAFSAVVHPFPEGFQGTHEEICLQVERYPDWVLVVVVAMWGATALISTRAARIVGNWYAAVVVAMLLLAALATNLAMLPYPLWFKVANLFVLTLACLAGATRRPARHSGTKS